MNFFYKNAVNVFTDASLATIEHNGSQMKVVCPAYVTTMGGGVLEYGSRVFSKTTNSYGEIFAILLGLQSLLRFADSDLFLNIYSDSEISVKGLTIWLLDWYQKGKDKFILSAKSGGPVRNQEVFLEIVRLIVKHNVHVSFYNVLGHTNKNSVKDMFKFSHYFYKSNNLYHMSMPTEILQEMAGFNDMVDNMSRDTLYKVIKTEDPLKYKKKNPTSIYWFPKDDDINKYYQLIKQ